MTKPNPNRRKPHCKICKHADCARIEVMCADQCFSQYDVAREFGVPQFAVQYHWARHVSASRKAELISGPANIAKLARLAVSEDRSLLEYYSIIRSELLRLFMDAKNRGLTYDASNIAQRLLNTLDSIGKLTGQLRNSGIVINNNNIASVSNSSPTTIVLNDPAIVRLQSVIIRSLAPFPEARSAVIGALRELEPVKASGHSRPSVGLPGPVIDMAPSEAANA